MKRLAALFVLSLALPVLADDGPAKCKLVRVADWHVRFAGSQPIVDGSINGKNVAVLIDSGSYTSVITKPAAARLELSTRSTSKVMVGVGGESRMLLAQVEELKVGDFSTKGLRLLVAGESEMRGIDLVLGHDFLRNVDVEFDYARGAVRLFQPLDCKDRPLAYWDADAQQLPLNGSDQDLVSVSINGRGAIAQIDSGASHSIVHLDFAEKLGITPRSPGVEPSSCIAGFGADAVREWVARYDTVVIAGETIRNARIRLSEFLPDYYYWRAVQSPDMLLGGDFLKAHRVLVAHSQGKVYLTYTGGLVFPAIAALECGDDRVKGNTPKELIAAYDELVARNPADAKSLQFRANLRASQGDLAGALSDLDAAIRIESSNGVALSTRSRIRFALQDYEGAFTDSDAAIANGMGTAEMYAYRAAVRRAQGDTARAIVELDRALDLDPHNVRALRTRGRLRYNTGKFEGAENDFATVLAIRTDAFDTLFLYLARARQGHDAREPLEQGLAKLKAGEWPAPILAYLLDRTDRDSLMRSASADEKERKGRECEARFYVAERFLIAGKKDDARPLFEAARDECPKNYVEYESAIAELDKLK
ncbi:MAG: aspartyl protease family protein [Usitatibacter sp.]